MPNLSQSDDSNIWEHTMRKGDNNVVICVLPKISLACRKCVKVAYRSVRTSATVALMKTVAFRPAFRSSFEDRTESTSWVITLTVDCTD